MYIRHPSLWDIHWLFFNGWSGILPLRAEKNVYNTSWIYQSRLSCCLTSRVKHFSVWETHSLALCTKANGSWNSQERNVNSSFFIFKHFTKPWFSLSKLFPALTTDWTDRKVQTLSTLVLNVPSLRIQWIAQHLKIFSRHHIGISLCKTRQRKEAYSGYKKSHLDYWLFKI